MNTFRKGPLLLSLAALVALGLTAHPAAAQTTLAGNYSSQLNDGYDAVAGQSYTVFPSAIFDKNGGSGLNVNNTSATILGGDFSHNGFDGVNTSFGAVVNITGGSFTHDFAGVEAFSSTVNITGGDFTGNSKLSLISYGSNITLFGDFATYGVVPNVTTFDPNPGSFTGRLLNDATSQTFTYGELDGGTITLAPISSPVPEASTTVSFGLLLALGLGGVGFVAKKKKAAAAS